MPRIPSARKLHGKPKPRRKDEIEGVNSAGFATDDPSGGNSPSQAVEAAAPAPNPDSFQSQETSPVTDREDSRPADRNGGDERPAPQPQPPRSDRPDQGHRGRDQARGPSPRPQDQQQQQRDRRP